MRKKLYGARSWAPALGADTEAVLGDILGLGGDEIEALRRNGAFG